MLNYQSVSLRELIPIAAAFLLGSLDGSADETRSNPRPATPAVAAAAGDWFEDVTEKVGIDFAHQFFHSRIASILLSNGAGGAVFDCDNDGLVDIYLVNWGRSKA